jgi:hypothetical protein
LALLLTETRQQRRRENSAGELLLMRCGTNGPANCTELRGCFGTYSRRRESHWEGCQQRRPKGKNRGMGGTADRRGQEACGGDGVDKMAARAWIDGHGGGLFIAMASSERMGRLDVMLSARRARAGWRTHAAGRSGVANGGMGRPWRCMSCPDTGVRARCCAEAATGRRSCAKWQWRRQPTRTQWSGSAPRRRTCGRWQAVLCYIPCRLGTCLGHRWWPTAAQRWQQSRQVAPAWEGMESAAKRGATCLAQAWGRR